MLGKIVALIKRPVATGREPVFQPAPPLAIDSSNVAEIAALMERVSNRRKERLRDLNANAVQTQVLTIMAPGHAEVVY